MRLPAELLTLILSLALSLSTASPLPRRSLSFNSLAGLTRLSHDASKPESVTRPDKFFHESSFDPHYDGRFADAELPHATRRFHLRLLVRSYVATMDRIGVPTWLMHGCLLGWWWNGQIMPWDKDVDMMLVERGMAELAEWWNMTVHAFTAGELGISEQDGLRDGEQVRSEGKKYLLEVNPHYGNRSTRDTHNVIDARWIDTSTGLYIDMTTIHAVPTPEETTPEWEAEAKFLQEASTQRSAYLSTVPEDTHLYTKDQHLFSAGQIFPLRTTTFEDITVRVPYAYESLLVEEYGPEALTETWFNGYGFHPEKKEWVVAEPTEEQMLRLMVPKKGRRIGAKKGNSEHGRKKSAENAALKNEDSMVERQ